nr:PREDICTED: F-box protein At5g06550 isoform X2 [Musa acuminata subsp. malaccensis]
MNQMESSLRVRRFEGLPSPDEFSSKIEPANVAAVFHGAVKDWKAISRWNPSDGGLDYLEESVGSSVLEAMLSRSGRIFYGDIRSHERVPIMNTERNERCPLETLTEDIQMPAFLGIKTLASINFWMNMAHSRSSTHYDPHHNLLCVVSGCKRVVLSPPSACSILYPMPVYGEASNHSAVNIEKPDFSVHPRAKNYEEHSQKIVLHPGDALFIPEGWFHQVDSDDLTIAVNFWWKSDMMSNMLEHMDPYYLRRILNRLVEKEKNHVLHESFSGGSKFIENYQLADDASEDNHEMDRCKLRDTTKESSRRHGILQQLEPFALHVLYELVSLVHNTISVDNQNGSTESTSKDSSSPDVEKEQIVKDNPPLSEIDTVANIFLAVEPLVLRNILLGMVHHFPRTLEALILHMLSPKGAEVLTRKFDEMDQQIMKEEQCEFYRQFYGVFDDQFAAMDAILNGKELFALQAFKNVLDKYLGAHPDQRNS